MAQRKQKALKKTTVQIRAGLFPLVVSAIGCKILHHLKLIGGCGAFVIVFGVVAANAFWYQPGVHPSPFLRTRNTENPNRIGGYRPAEPLGVQGNVTTIRIGRLAEMETAPSPAARIAAPLATENQKPQQIVTDIQIELKKRGLYEGKVDGRMGPRTAVAIMCFEETLNIEQTGKPTTRVLAALRINGATITTIPRDRPLDINSGIATDLVTATICKAEAPRLKANPASLNGAMPRLTSRQVMN